MSHKEIYILFQLFYSFIGLVVFYLVYKIYKRNEPESQGYDDSSDEMLKYQKGIFYILVALFLWIFMIDFIDMVQCGGMLCD